MCTFPVVPTRSSTRSSLFPETARDRGRNPTDAGGRPPRREDAMHVNESVALVGCALLSLSLGGCAAKVADDEVASQSSALSSAEREDVPPLPSPVLEVPAGNRLAFSFDASGVQTYTCNGSTWVNAPIANLYDKNGKLV